MGNPQKKSSDQGNGLPSTLTVTVSASNCLHSTLPKINHACENKNALSFEKKVFCFILFLFFTNRP